MKAVFTPQIKSAITNNASGTPSVAISIVTWNSAAEIRECLRPLADLPVNWEVWVADNQSADETVEIIRNEFPFVKLIANADNKGFAEANNQVVDRTRTDYVLFLNPDTRGTAKAFVRALEVIAGNPRAGVLGVRLSNEDGTTQTTCFHFPTFWKNFIDNFGLQRLYGREKVVEMFAGEYFAHDAPRRVDWVKGAFMLVRRAALDKAGAIPEDYFMFAEDLDFCWQIARAGYEIEFSPAVTVLHSSNKSAGQLPSEWRIERTTLSKYLFCLKNFGFIKGRLIQLIDLLGINYKIFRRRLNEKDSTEIREWKMFRREICKSILMSRRKISAKLQQR